MSQSPSLAELAAVPEIGALIFDRRPAFLWQPDGRRILFANAAGVAWFGADSLAALSARTFSAANPASKAIERLARALPFPGARIEPLRVPLGATIATLTCLCQRVILPGRGAGALLTAGLDAFLPEESLERTARRAVAALAGSADVLILAEDGTPLAASHPALAEAARSAFGKVHGGVERRVAWIAGTQRTLEIISAQAGEERVTIVFVGDAEVVEPVAPAPATAAAAPRASRFAFAGAGAPVRFVFTVDPDQRVTMISPEFAGVVGPESAAIVSQHWPEIAARLGIDGDGQIARALARRETWSGITVNWPVDESELAVPVDLAALPAFGRSRSFEGFRGFGVARPADAVRAGAAVERSQASAAPEAPKQTAPSAAIHVLPPRDDATIVRLPIKPDAAASVPLSGIEEAAFRQIAEALGARFEESVPAESGGATQAIPLHLPSIADPRMLERVPLGILVQREDRAIYANRTFLEMIGQPSLAAFERAGGLSSVFPDSVGGVPSGGDALFARRSDGSKVRVEARMASTPWGEGGALMLTFRALPDDDERHDALVGEFDAAKDRIEELESILDTATDGVLVIDGAARIASANRAAEALFGIEARAVVGKPFTDLLADESHKAALDYLDGLASNGVASVLNDGREVIGRVPNGGLIPLFMTMGRLSTHGKFCAVLRDITHWKRAEEELTTAKREAERANEQKSEFLAKVSHEIRTPLNAVIGFSEVMMEERFGPIGNERYRQYLRDIHLSGAHLMSLINDLLDLSKIEAGKVELSFESVRVNEIIQDCVALMQPQANRERIIIRTSLSSGVPNVVADSRSLRQIVLNLLSNAIKFTQPGGQVIVSTGLEDSGEVVIRVRDTGVGMSEKDIETALQPFRQVTTSERTRFDGTGLGLPLTKALVEANRAAFSIDSAVDQGTLVRITFPTTRVLAE